MASMNRNVNLEEVNTDAFMGISYLNYQSMLQKVVFIGGIVIGIAINLVGTFLLEININVTMILTLVPILSGVAFGCNFNEDLSLIKYFKLLISKPVETFYSKPAEDLEQLHQEVDRIKEEAELKQRQQEKMSDEAQRKLLIRMGVVAVVVIVVFVAVLVGIKMMQPEELHHTVQIVAPIS